MSVNEEHINRFKRFLKEKGVYGIYLHHTREYYQKYLDKAYNNHLQAEYFLKHSYKEQWIGHAFCWKYTAEGHDFWYELNKQWRRQCMYD